MADYAIHDTTLEAIADTIRKKDGSVALIDPADYADRINLMGMLEEKTTTKASISNLTDGAQEVPIKAWGVDIAANLSGVSSLDCTQTKKNLYDVSSAVYGADFYDASGNVVQYADCAVSWIKCKPSTQYSFTCTKETSQTVNVRVAWCKSDKSFISRQGLFSDNQFPMTLTTPSNCEWIQLSVNQYATAQVSQNNFNLQVEENATATAFEAYSGTVSTVSLGRTIYGGSVDVVAGTGEATHGKLTLTSDMIDNAISYTYQNKVGVQIANVFPVNVIRQTENLCYVDNGDNTGYYVPVKQGASSEASYMWFGSASGNKYLYWVGVLDDMSMTLEQWKTWALAKTITCVYTLPTPTDFTFPPISPTPETKLGVNNFWSDSGNSEIVYRSSGTMQVYPTAEEASF